MQYWVAGVFLACAAVNAVVVPVVFAMLGRLPYPSPYSVFLSAFLGGALAIWGGYWLRKGWLLLKVPTPS
jgi:hypothetical protein